jgi:hypothetical protein
MKLNQHLKGWKQIISYRFPRLSLPQISGLATWSFGMVMTQSSSLTKVSTLIAKVNQEPENTVRQRLKEWYKSGEAKAKKGNKRGSMDVTKCFASLLQWIIDLLPQTTKELPIAIDATSIGQNFTVLSVNVLYRRCAIPIASKVVKGTSKGSWQPHWKQLFQAFNNIVPQDYLVIVSADRGLYASWLYEEIIALGWHKTRLRQPDRAERHWLAMSVAMLCMLTLGGEQEFFHEQSLISDRSSASFPISTPSLSGFINGLLTVIAQLLNGQSISFGRLFPLPFNHFIDLHFSNSS